MKWLNPDPNLHIDMLRMQARIGEGLYIRFLNEGRYDDAVSLWFELNLLMKVIYKKIYGN